jgi:Holliday junction resolvase-like predicted endonuclease
MPSGCRTFVAMENKRGPSIRFVLNGQRYELAREDVEQRLADVAPDAIRKHAVRVNGIWFPVIQAFEVATGIPRSEFISHSARRHLAALEFEVAGEIEPRAEAELPRPRAGYAPVIATSRDLKESRQPSEEWHTEANVQASLVTAMAAGGWRILSVANTATKEHGVDVIGSRDSQTVGVEVKGFPSRSYADPARAGEAKRTRPSTQAAHWYAQAVLAAMRLRGKEPTWRSVIALPDFPRYRDLHAETAAPLAAAQIEIWWVDQVGLVHWS